MESATTTPTQQDKQITVDVPRTGSPSSTRSTRASWPAAAGAAAPRARPGGRHHGDCHGHRRAEDREAPEAAEA